MRKILAAGVVGAVFFVGLGVSPAFAEDATTDTPAASDSASPDATTLKLSRSTYTSTYKAATATVKVTTSAASWSAADDADWVTLTPASGASGEKFTIAVADNLGAQRTATVTVTAGGQTATVAVTQKAAPASIVVTPTDTWTADWEGDSTTVTVTVNTGADWTASTSSDWVTISKTAGASGDKVTVTAAENTGKARLGTVKFKSGTLTKSYIFKQESGPVLTLSRSTWTASNDGEEGSVRVNSPLTPWKASVAADCASWTHITPSSGVDDDRIYMTVDQNEAGGKRTCVLTVDNGYHTKTVTITQKVVTDWAAIFSALLTNLFKSLSLLFGAAS
jgi:hypothetical protein